MHIIYYIFVIFYLLIIIMNDERSKIKVLDEKPSLEIWTDFFFFCQDYIKNSLTEGNSCYFDYHITIQFRFEIINVCVQKWTLNFQTSNTSTTIHPFNMPRVLYEYIFMIICCEWQMNICVRLFFTQLYKW